MSHPVQNFEFQSHILRMIPDENGEPWFIAMDVAEILGYKDTEAMTRKLDEDEIQNLRIVGFGNRGVTTINESGLYASILTSHKPEAKAFKRWVTHEVLPAIRKHGYYVNPAHHYDNTLPDLPPLHRVSSALLSELRRMSKSLAKVYLLECGVTPNYIAAQLARLDASPAALATPPDHDPNPMPFHLLQQEVPEQAEAQDDRYYYFRRPAFEKLCGDYDPTDTARMLRDKQLLKYQGNYSLMMRAPRAMFGGQRPLMYAIKKTIRK
ncbi:BRO-N domain-containing protein [Methylomicrobium sp. RS1]|uniref:BRO-N domain-containing protein n=1 Tax=Candidatus Methylomicrobium oryzae TaxID=2802053 RepID=UPI0019204003|nr:Bro-N domain-containing protein [Methylomicrobium sp. RS1]MBL1262806.1 Bro-N domain-containing protein [Methylomicrobium sp. RS1]